MNYEKETLKQAQHDILTSNTKNNELMTPHMVMFLNKALKTTQPNIVNSINEIFLMSGATDTKFKNFADFYNSILMDINTVNGQVEYEKMQKIAPTVIESINRLGGSINKTISFQFFKKPKNIKRLTIRSPYNGKITGIFASCGIAGDTDTELTIEKIRSVDYATNGTWIDILSVPITIKGGALVDDGNAEVSVEDVEADDIFRIRLVSEDTTLEDLNVQIEYYIE